MKAKKVKMYQTGGSQFSTKTIKAPFRKTGGSIKGSMKKSSCK